MSELKVASCYEFEKVLRGKSNKLFYPKFEVDAAITELKAENERLVKCCKEYDSRQRIDERIKFNGAQQLRSTKRALFLARAMRADDAAHWTVYVTYMHYHENSFYAFDGDDIFHRNNKNLDGFKLWCSKWETVKVKCLKKAEAYK